jgi:phage recombination protein Bet
VNTTLAVKQDQNQWDATQLAALRQIGLSDAPAGDLALFLHYAQKTGLDPFSRQIYMIGRWDSRSGGNRYTIQSSIDGLRIIAQRSGEYAGQTEPKWCGDDGVWKDVWLSQTAPTAAKIGVYRQGFAEPLYAVATIASYMPTGKDGKPQGLWSKMPDVMLAKVAEALALRKAFPNDLSGIYVSEEMDQADAKVTAAPVAIEATPALSDTRKDELVKAIAGATSKEELRKLWIDNGDVLEIAFTNSLGDQTTLKALIMSKQGELK